MSTNNTNNTNNNIAGWFASDGNVEIHFETAETAEEAAQEYVDGGDWGPTTRTSWIDVRVWQRTQDGDSLSEESVLVEIQPPEPECEEGEHEYVSPYSVVGGLRENPGVAGHGGGVIVREMCRHCGIYRVTDTWAQGPDGTEGLESVAYEEANEASLEWVEAHSRDRRARSLD